MKMVSHYGSNINWKRTNVQLASLACGVALAAVAIVGGSEVLRDRGDSGTSAPVRVAQPTGPAFDPADLGSLGIEYALAQQEALAASSAVLQDARGIGQAGEGTTSAEATLIDPTDFGSLGIESVLRPQYGSEADAVYDAMNPSLVQPVSAAAVVGLQNARGIGQPGEGTASVEATLIDPTDFGSLGIESVVAEQPSASPDEDFGGNYLPYGGFTPSGAGTFPPEAATDYSLPTTFAADFFGAGQPGEGVTTADAPLFGTMVDAVYVIESNVQLP